MGRARELKISSGTKKVTGMKRNCILCRPYHTSFFVENERLKERGGLKARGKLRKGKARKVLEEAASAP